jgi:hypothetical protein
VTSRDVRIVCPRLKHNLTRGDTSYVYHAGCDLSQVKIVLVFLTASHIRSARQIKQHVTYPSRVCSVNGNLCFVRMVVFDVTAHWTRNVFVTLD